MQKNPEKNRSFSFAFQVFDKSKNGVLAGLYEDNGAHEDEIGEDGLRFPLADMCQLQEFL